MPGAWHGGPGVSLSGRGIDPDGEMREVEGPMCAQDQVLSGGIEEQVLISTSVPSPTDHVLVVSVG